MATIDYLQSLSHHYKPKKGWVNDPNGLVWFDGFYHVFYQHAPDHEKPWIQPMHWGHARTRDFINWEELPVALYPDQPYDVDGCWSGTATVKDGILYLFYASIRKDARTGKLQQTVSVAYSSDGVHFEKYPGNPVIDHYPADGGPDFRDPAICCIDGRFYCVMATGNPESKTGRLLLYRSEDLFAWKYCGIMSQWENCEFTECPSFMQNSDGSCLLTVSVCPLEENRYFSIMYGTFADDKFRISLAAEVDKGPDQYAGQVFHDFHKGRDILITWMPGWAYSGYAPRDVGCMSVPREIFEKDGKVYGYPVEEVRHLLKTSDPAVRRREDGFVVERTGREPVIHTGRVERLEMIRDGYILEIFVNGGETVYSVLL